MDNENDIPEVYQDLINRVREIEENLSKVIQSSHVVKTGMHEKENKAKEVDDDLQTDKVSPITIQSSAYLKMAVHAKRYANNSIPKEKWVEVIGLLTGKVVNENTPIEQITITEAWPIGHGDAVSVQIMESNSVTQVMDQLPEGEFIVGWYHSHPSYGNFLSIDDYNTQHRYQKLWDKAIAIVIDPTEISNSDYGFGVFRNTDKKFGTKGYTELTCEVEGLSTKAGYEILKLIRPAFEGNELRFLEYE